MASSEGAAVLLTACAPASGQQSELGKGGQPVSIRAFEWASVIDGETMKAIIEAYHATQTRVRVEVRAADRELLREAGRHPAGRRRARPPEHADLALAALRRQGSRPGARPAAAARQVGRGLAQGVGQALRAADEAPRQAVGAALQHGRHGDVLRHGCVRQGRRAGAHRGLDVRPVRGHRAPAEPRRPRKRPSATRPTPATSGWRAGCACTARRSGIGRSSRARRSGASPPSWTPCSSRCTTSSIASRWPRRPPTSRATSIACRTATWP